MKTQGIHHLIMLTASALSLLLSSCAQQQLAPQSTQPIELPTFGTMKRYTASDVAMIRSADETWLCVHCGSTPQTLDNVTWVYINGKEIDELAKSGSASPAQPATPTNQQTGQPANQPSRPSTLGQAARPNTPPLANAEVVSQREFDFNSSRLKGNPAGLERILELARSNPDSVINITGHTDDIGSDNYNQRLSERRAQVLSDWLIAKGIPPTRIRTEGRGKREPAIAQKSETAREINRRAVIQVSIRESQHAAS